MVTLILYLLSSTLFLGRIEPQNQSWFLFYQQKDLQSLNIKKSRTSKLSVSDSARTNWDIGLRAQCYETATEEVTSLGAYLQSARNVGSLRAVSAGPDFQNPALPISMV